MDQKESRINKCKAPGHIYISQTNTTLKQITIYQCKKAYITKKTIGHKEQLKVQELNLVQEADFWAESFVLLSHGNFQSSLNLVHDLCITFLLGLPSTTQDLS
jgi:hypothetical protein